MKKTKINIGLLKITLEDDTIEQFILNKLGSWLNGEISSDKENKAHMELSKIKFR